MPKKFKVKEYKEPREKYIVIVEPWGRFGPNSLEDVNRIYWWLVDMLSDTHPNDHPNVIYYQDTRNDVIVELPESVDISLYLGAHVWGGFLDGPHQIKCSEIYKYNWKRLGEPGNHGWSMGTVQEKSVRPTLKTPFPPPQIPAQRVRVPYAQPLGEDELDKIRKRLEALALPPPLPPPQISDRLEASASLSSAQSPYHSNRRETYSPTRYQSKSATLDLPPDREADGKPCIDKVKSEPLEEKIGFSIPKVEEDEEKKPFLTGLSQEIPTLSVPKLEEEEKKSILKSPSPEEKPGYVPGTELMAAFASLPAFFFTNDSGEVPAIASKVEPKVEEPNAEIRIKDEPLDHDHSADPRDRSTRPSTSGREDVAVHDRRGGIVRNKFSADHQQSHERKYANDTGARRSPGSKTGNIVVKRERDPSPQLTLSGSMTSKRVKREPAWD